MATSLRSLPSAITDPRLAFDLTLDPFYDGAWTGGSDAIWLSKAIADKRTASGILGQLPAWLRVEPEDLLASKVRREAVLDVLAAMSWRTVTQGQLAQITGRAELLGAEPAVLAQLWVHGLIDLGMLDAWGHGGAQQLLIRPSAGPAFEKDVAPRLTRAEMVRATGGRWGGAQQQHTRHNLLANHLALSTAAFLECGGVAGELFGSYADLAYRRAGRVPPVGLQKAADALILRTDGLAIAVELQVSVGRQLVNKVRTIAEILHNVRLEDSGLVVVFVVAPTASGQDNYNAIRDLVRRAAWEYPGPFADPTERRMFVARYSDLFPSRHAHGESFAEGLVAERAGGDIASPWQHTSLLDVIDTPFEPTDAPRIEAGMHQLAALRQTPSWLRAPDRRVWWVDPVKELGFRGLPRPVPENGSRPYPLGVARGGAQTTTMPRRLR
jgi:hypothetical protein